MCIYGQFLMLSFIRTRTMLSRRSFLLENQISKIRMEDNEKIDFTLLFTFVMCHPKHINSFMYYFNIIK